MGWNGQAKFSGLDNHNAVINGHFGGENCGVFVYYRVVHKVVCILHSLFFLAIMGRGYCFPNTESLPLYGFM